MIKSTLFNIVFVLPWTFGFSQSSSSQYPQNLKIYFDFREGKILDTNSLVLKLIYKNQGRDTALVFSELIEGSLHDPIGNLYFELQVLKGKKYVSYSMISYDYFYSDSLQPPPRKFVLLPPRTSLQTTFNILPSVRFIGIGKYRIRFHLLILPSDTSKKYYSRHIKSNWFLLEAEKNIETLKLK